MMVDRFLRYSLEHQRKIAVIVQDQDGIRRMNIIVTRIEADTVYHVTARSKKEKALARDQILSASYARGDDGDTMKQENGKL